MTSVGRGRGWGSVQDKGVPLRRPGEAAIVADVEVDGLIAAVQGINLNGDGDSVAILRGVEELVRSQCQTEETLRSVVQRLHDRSLEDRQFGMKAAAACATVSSLEVAGIKLRNVLLQMVQKDFENKAHLQTACNSKFLNAIALLGEIFHRVRMPDGSPINVLATAVLQYQDMLLAGEEHEMELFTTQLAVNGRKLYDCRASKLEELMLRVRTMLMSRNLSGHCRCWLLLALDLAANRYAPLSGQLQSFYQVHLGANAILQLQRIQLGLTVDVAAAIKPVETGGSGDGILAKCKLPEQTATVQNGVIIRPSVKVVRTYSEGSKKITSPIEEHRKTSSSAEESVSGNVGRKHPVEESASGNVGRKYPVEESAAGNVGRKYPVEETGGGARKYSQEKNRRKSSGGPWRDDNNKNDDIWGSARGEKTVVWGHDDRFTKDDDFYGKQAQRGEGTSRPRNRDSTNWRERKSSNGEDKEQKTVTKPKNEESSFAPPPLPDDEENWD